MRAGTQGFRTRAGSRNALRKLRNRGCAFITDRPAAGKLEAVDLNAVFPTEACRYGGPEGRKNASPWREPRVWRCIGFQAPERRSESATLGLVLGETQDFLPTPAFLIAPPRLWFFSWAVSPRLTPWARVLPPRPGLEMDGSWRANCSRSTCSRPLNRGFRGARRPPLRQAGRPPLRRHGSWEPPLAQAPPYRR